MNLKWYIPLCVLVCVSLCGCSNKAKVDGMVRFSDGAPLEVGNVMMSDGRNMYQGSIKTGGQFSLGMLRDGEGIPPGKYKVWVTGVNGSSGTDPAAKNAELSREKNLVDPKFTSEATSELTVEVKKNEKKPLEIVVAKPGAK